MTYDAFGNVTTTGEASGNPFQFTSRENDGTGLLHYRYRYYSPEMQRFISEDPLRLLGGINYFNYTNNSPINFKDPLGLLTMTGWGVGGTLIFLDVSWNSANPTKTDVKIVTPQLGGGLQLCFKRDGDGCGKKPSLPIEHNVGKGEHVGISFPDDLSSFCINLGYSRSPSPWNIGKTIYTIDANE